VSKRKGERWLGRRQEAYVGSPDDMMNVQRFSEERDDCGLEERKV
jgi:hypothetical protein